MWDVTVMKKTWLSAIILGGASKTATGTQNSQLLFVNQQVRIQSAILIFNYYLINPLITVYWIEWVAFELYFINLLIYFIYFISGFLFNSEHNVSLNIENGLHKLMIGDKLNFISL